MRFLRFFAVSALFGSLSLGLRAQLVLSDFNAGTDGWLPYTAGAHDATIAVSWNATGGAGGTGGLVLNDPGSGVDDYYAAPAKFLGDNSVFYGGTLSYDLKLSIAPGGGTVDNVILTGNGLSLASAVHPAPLVGSFTSYTLTLTETSGWYLVGTATAPTQAQMQSVLSNTTGLRIWGDWGVGPEAETLDNVRLAAVPEPGTWALFGGGVLLLAARRKHRRAAL